MKTPPLKDFLPPLGALRAFEAAARHSSFTAAGEELNVSQAAVSQHVRGLEHNLRCQLFFRTPRGLKLTESGEAYLPIVQDTLNRLANGTERLFGDRKRRSLSIRMISTLAIAWLGPRLGRLADGFDGIDLEISTFQWNAEHPGDYVDLEVRYGTGSRQGANGVPLVQEHLVPVCAPALLARLSRPADILNFPLFHIVGTLDGWTEWLDLAGVDTAAPRTERRLDSSLVAYQAAERGAGIALGRTLLMEEPVRAGRLAVPFGIRLESRETYHLVRPAGARRDPEAERLAVWLTEEAAATAEAA